jgi:N-acetylmuramoyl-L-alanine amidase
MREVNELIIHSSATREGANIGADDIRRWHVIDNGWSCIGYHFVIRRSGCVEPGRALRMAGAHVSGRNANSVGICMVGGVAADGRTAEDNFTQAQWASLIALVEKLRGQFPGATVHGHNEFSATACPSFVVRKWWEQAQHHQPVSCDGAEHGEQTDLTLAGFEARLASLRKLPDLAPKSYNAH